MIVGSSKGTEAQAPEVMENLAMGLRASEQASHLIEDRSTGAPEIEFAKAMYRCLRGRDRVFGHGLFSDPVWDILLLLHVRRAEGVTYSFAEICEALPASPETLSRCLSLLESRELVLRIDNSPAAPLQLSSKALEMMDKVFSSSSSLAVQDV